MKKHLEINFAISFWILALISWILEVNILVTLSGILSMSGFILHTQQYKHKEMFKKKNVDSYQLNQTPIPDIKSNEATIIAKNTVIEGDVTSNGVVYISGNLKGNINAKDGLVKIINGGSVEGDISSKNISIDGDLIGSCISSHLEINENGKVSGNITYHTLMIKEGGLFSGQAEILQQDENKNKVIAITTDIKP